MKKFRAIRKILLVVAIIVGIAALVMPRTKPLFRGLQERVKEALDEGRIAARSREEELKRLEGLQ